MSTLRDLLPADERELLAWLDRRRAREPRWSDLPETDRDRIDKADAHDKLVSMLVQYLASGWVQKELAALLDVSVQAINQWLEPVRNGTFVARDLPVRVSSRAEVAARELEVVERRRAIVSAALQLGLDPDEVLRIAAIKQLDS